MSVIATMMQVPSAWCFRAQTCSPRPFFKYVSVPRPSAPGVVGEQNAASRSANICEHDVSGAERETHTQEDDCRFPEQLHIAHSPHGRRIAQRAGAAALASASAPGVKLTVWVFREFTKKKFTSGTVDCNKLPILPFTLAPFAARSLSAIADWHCANRASVRATPRKPARNTCADAWCQ